MARVWRHHPLTLAGGVLGRRGFEDLWNTGLAHNPAPGATVCAVRVVRCSTRCFAAAQHAFDDSSSITGLTTKRQNAGCCSGVPYDAFREGLRIDVVNSFKL